MNAKLPQVTITTDGGCDPNPGAGAWAAILRFGNVSKTLSGADPATTNNRMELTAIAESLEALKSPCKVKLRTDSQQSIFAVCAGYFAEDTKKRRKWEAKGKNMDLVRRIWAQCARHEINPVWIKAHAGDHDNEACDRLCTEVISKHFIRNVTKQTTP